MLVKCIGAKGALYLANEYFDQAIGDGNLPKKLKFRKPGKINL